MVWLTCLRRAKEAGPGRGAQGWRLIIPRFQHLDEGVLGDVDFAEGFHFGFPFFLLLEELALSGDVAAVAFGGDVFAHGGDRFARDVVTSNGGLDGDDEHLGGDDVLKLGGNNVRHYGRCYSLLVLKMDWEEHGVVALQDI
jgi:hypothetical protein